MTSENMYEWLGAVEFLINAEKGWNVKNGYGDYVIVGDMCSGRYKKYDRSGEFCGFVDSAAEAVFWLYENNKSNDEF